MVLALGIVGCGTRQQQKQVVATTPYRMLATSRIVTKVDPENGNTKVVDTFERSGKPLRLGGGIELTHSEHFDVPIAFDSTISMSPPSGKEVYTVFTTFDKNPGYRSYDAVDQNGKECSIFVARKRGERGITISYFRKDKGLDSPDKDAESHPDE